MKNKVDMLEFGNNFLWMLDASKQYSCGEYLSN